MVSNTVRYHREVSYPGRGNRIRLRFRRYDPVDQAYVDLAWDQVVAWRLALVDLDGVVAGPFESADHPEMITAQVEGVLELQLGGLPIDPGEYRLRLTAFDSFGDATEIANEGHRQDVILLRIAATSPALP